MASLFDIRDKAKRAEGNPPAGEQLRMQPQSDQGDHAAALEAGGRTLPPFMGTDSGRDYRAIYRAIFECHERNNPPRLTREYWEKAADDINATASRFHNDPFVFALLVAVYDELEREYRKLEERNQGNICAV